MGRHEVDVLGRYELGGEHQVALVLAAVLVIDEDHHLAGADLVQRALDSFDRAHRGPPTSFSTCFARISVSRFTRSPIASAPRVVWIARVRDDRDGECLRIHRVDRERHACDRDRALLDDVAQQRGRRPHDQHEVRTEVAARGELAGSVDVTGHPVTTEPIAHTQRTLEVDARAIRAAPIVVRASVSAPASTV